MSYTTACSACEEGIDNDDYVVIKPKSRPSPHDPDAVKKREYWLCLDCMQSFSSRQTRHTCGWCGSCETELGTGITDDAEFHFKIQVESHGDDEPVFEIGHPDEMDDDEFESPTVYESYRLCPDCWIDERNRLLDSSNDDSEGQVNVSP
jgi:hypothetical protein